MARVAKGASDRSFGLTFAVVFALVGLWPSVFHASRPHWWALAVAVLFAAAAVSAPRVLTPLNWVWLRFGLLLHHITNPVLMALIYVFALLPTGLLMKARGKDLLRLKRDAGAGTYWIPRDPPGPPPETMAKQF